VPAGTAGRKKRGGGQPCPKKTTKENKLAAAHKRSKSENLGAWPSKKEKKSPSLQKTEGKEPRDDPTAVKRTISSKRRQGSANNHGHRRRRLRKKPGGRERTAPCNSGLDHKKAEII